MNRSSIARFALAAVLAAGATPLSALRTTQAQSIGQPFTTRIYIQNPNSSAATGIVNFYDEITGNPQSVNVPFNLNANGSTEILIGSLTGLGSPWKGSAVVSADQPVVASSVQVPPTGYGHIMANAFTSADSTSSLFLTTFLGAGNPTNSVSLFAVQNTESVPINIRARFINISGIEVASPTLTLPAFASKFFDGNNASSIGGGYTNPFNGSVVVTATKVSDGTPALIVGVAEERRTDTGGLFSSQAYGFEAIPQSAGSTTVYMPTALCNFGGATTYFAAQNLSFNTPTVVTVTYAAGSGTTPSPAVNTIQPLAKWSFNPCQTNGNQSYSGAAVIQSSAAPVAAIGKAREEVGTNPRYQTAYLAQATSTSRLAIPFVRWSPANDQGFRSFIAIQNIGPSPIPAGQLTVKYYAPSGGAPVNTCTSAVNMPAGAKLNSNVAAAFAGGTNFNCSTTQPANGASYTFSGSAVVEGPPGSSIIAVIRYRPDNAAVQVHTEDMNAIPLP